MRTIFTNEDIKRLLDNIFNGNLSAYLDSNGTIQYNNPNSEDIVFIDENGNKKEMDLAQCLNVKFYSWKQRLVEKDSQSRTNEPEMSLFDDWVQSLNVSMNESYALVEKINEEVVNSEDIDSSNIDARVTFIMQTNKIQSLDYYVTKLRNLFLGNPQTIQNSFGNDIKAYFMIGSLTYDEEPMMTQLGEVVITSLNMRISYLNDAQAYNDTQVLISLDGDDNYDENGDIVGTTKYLEMPITKHTWQLIFSDSPVPTVDRPDLTGFVANTLSSASTLSFFDFNKTLTNRFNELFWASSAYRIDGILSPKRDVNIPVYVKIVNGGHSYIFKDMISQMGKTFTNSDFTISTITLKGWGKIQ